MQNFGSSREVLIRLHPEKGQTSADLSQKVMELLKADGKPVELRRVEFVGPQVGEELAEYGALALLVTAVGIVLYLWMRFEWRFGLSAIIANLHDVVIILGCFAFFQWEFSLPVLAAVLAVLGYSVNESVVVFDRVRENFRKMRKAPRAGGDRQLHHRRDLAHHHHARLHAGDGHHHADLRRPGAALLRAGAHHRHPASASTRRCWSRARSSCGSASTAPSSSSRSRRRRTATKAPSSRGQTPISTRRRNWGLTPILASAYFRIWTRLE